MTPTEQRTGGDPPPTPTVRADPAHTANAGGAQPPGPGPDFAEFYAARYGPMTVALYAYTGDLATAQDLAQDAFCRAYLRWPAIRTYEDPSAWVRRVAWNLATNRWRRLRRARAYAKTLREPQVDGPSPDRVALVSALAKLPPRHRRAVVLYHLADLPTAEIAAQEGVAEATVRVWLHRGRTALSAYLSDPRTEHRDA